jgi:phage-related protein
MREVKEGGMVLARHLDEGIYEVRTDGNRVTYRVLFAPQGKRKQILLALEAFKKKTQKTPTQTIALAKQRLRDWEERGSRLQKRRSTVSQK